MHKNIFEESHLWSRKITGKKEKDREQEKDMAESDLTEHQR